MLDEILLWISGDFFFWGGGIWGCFGLVFFLVGPCSLDCWFLWKADAKDEEKRQHGFYMILLCSNRCKDTWTEFYLIFMTKDCLYNWICSMFGDEPIKCLYLLEWSFLRHWLMRLMWKWSVTLDVDKWYLHVIWIDGQWRVASLSFSFFLWHCW